MNLDIASMEAAQKFEAFTVLEEHTKLVSFEPHMHAAGVRMCIDAIWGRTNQIDTLSCVGYDHTWVRTYNFADDAAPLLPERDHRPYHGLLRQHARKSKRCRPSKLVGFGSSLDRQHDESPSRLLKNTRIGLFSWPSCVSRPPPTTVRTGDTLSRRGGQRHPRPAIRDTSPPDSATGPSYRRWRRR